jgi:CHAD domain-containing protein
VNQPGSTRTATRRIGARKPDASQEQLRKLTASLRSNLDRCAADPDIDPVHDVRTGTRRLQAMIEAILRERADDALQQAAGQWLNLLKKMRRAAAPVRDLDVHRKLLKKLIKYGSTNEGPGQTVQTSSEGAVTGPVPDIVEIPASELPTNTVENQAEHLDAWLHHARQHNAAALKKKAAKLLSKFDEEAEAFASSIKQSRARRRRCPAAIVALEFFARLVYEMPQLDAKNLHDFRKGAKKARYIAESAQDAHAVAVGKALKKMQDDVGDWHDWLVLADEARMALGDQKNDLITLLDAERDRHYVLAMKTVNQLRGRLMGEWLALSQPRRR